ncbi:MAG: zinc ribbon domain-containing protein [Deltaproteobacteria bacterium]|nr:zinc ribbon domain-containing protein [Deltaproteobacteria bacterium]
MRKEDMIPYLANAALVSVADGEFNPDEAKAIDSIRKEIGAGEQELKEALNIVARGGLKLMPVGRFSDKVRNLEDMIFVSLVDGKLDKKQKPEILSFAKAIKISQTQLTQLLSETKLRLKPQSGPIKCPSCSKEIPPESKFCPFCGGKI